MLVFNRAIVLREGLDPTASLPGAGSLAVVLAALIVPFSGSRHSFGFQLLSLEILSILWAPVSAYLCIDAAKCISNVI